MCNVPDNAEDEISLLDIAITLKQNIKLLVLGSAASGLIAFGSGFLISPTFTASTSFLSVQREGQALAPQYADLMKSRSVQDALVSRFDLESRYEVRLHDDALRALGTAVRITAGKDGLTRIEVDDRDPAFAAQLANAHVEELRKLVDRLALTEAQQRRTFYEKQLVEAKSRLTATEAAWQTRAADPRTLRSDAKMAAEAYAGLKASVTAAHVKLQSMRRYQNERSPEFKLAQSELGTLLAQLSKSEAASNDTADERVVRYRDLKYYQSLVEVFTMQYELAKFDEALDGAMIEVVDTAQTPERPSKPKKTLIAILATLATGFALLLFVFIREAWRNSLKDEVTAQKLKQLF